MYKNLLEYIVKNLVTYPEKIEISEAEADGKIVLKLKVAKEDMGRIIGKEGRMNYPSTLSTLNWSFRITKEQFDNSKEQLGYLLSRYVKIYGRNK